MAGVAGSEDEDFLEEYFDVVILSTGLGSSILAAALAKSGKRVLHLDRNDHYGDQIASFSFLQLLDWVERHRESSDEGRSTEPSPEPDFDLERAGKAIARAHAREEMNKKENMKKNRAANLAGEKGVAESEGERDNERGEMASIEAGAAGLIAEQENDRVRSENAAESAVDKGPRPGAKESVLPLGAPETEEREDLGVSGRNDFEKIENGERVVETCAKDGTEKTADKSISPAADPAVYDGGKQEVGEAAQTCTEQEHDGVNVDKTVEEDADKRFRSFELRLLPLSHHGCQTRAGAPSDACTQERLQQKSSEDAAAAAAFGRPVRPTAPSHPAWIGRREPRKASEGGNVDGGRREVESLHPAFWSYRVGRRPDPTDLVRLSRSFNLDLTSQVLLATGAAVDAMVSSGVANYLEFKDMPALYMGSDDAPSTATATSSAKAAPGSLPKPGVALEKNENGSTNSRTGGVPGAPTVVPATKASPPPSLRLSRVPCSKADVFGTKLLTPLEKRRLMRFLLFASDWGLQRAGENVSARNEAGLGRGRSLRRPQNREAASGDFDAVAHAGRPFQEFLESCGLPERVRAMVTYALALLPGGEGVGSDGDKGAEENATTTTEDGLEAVYRHLSALGRFGETAFISPIYGLGELPQSFCRMAAVYGAVYVLRRQLKGALVDGGTGRCVGVVDESGRPLACGSLVIGEEYFIPPPLAKTASESKENPGSPDHLAPSLPSTPAEETPDPSGKPIAKSSRKDPYRRQRQRQRLLRRIVVASGPAVSPDGDGRGLCVLPPGLRCVGNTSAVHVISLDESTAACPGGLDGACVLHLTTTVVLSRDGDAETTIEEEENGGGGVLARAAKELLAAAGVEEIWSVGFSWSIGDQVALAEEDLPANVAICQRPGQELYLHEVFVQAERAFSRLCPGEPFWPPPPNASNGEDEYQAEMLRAAAASAMTA